jgi:hypothetical protein
MESNNITGDLSDVCILMTRDLISRLDIHMALINQEQQYILVSILSGVVQR